MRPLTASKDLHHAPVIPKSNAMTDASTFLKTRRSRPAKLLTAPYPDRDTIAEFLTMAARTPDHGKLEPWRFIVVEHAAMARLADLAALRGAA